MNHHEIPDLPNSGGESKGVSYYFILACMFICSKLVGISKSVSYVINTNVDLPNHDITYVPELRELIPALVLTACCGVVSFLVQKLASMAWKKVFPK